MKGIRRVRRSKKRLIIGLLCLLIVAGTGTVIGLHFYGKNKDTVEAATYTRTTRLMKTTLSDSVSVTGTVASASVAEISSEVSGEIKEVLVQEGDAVTKGETICTLDTAEIEEQIEKQEDALSKTSQEAQDSYDSAKEDRDDASVKYTDAKSELADLKDTLDDAEAAYDAAVASVKSEQAAYDKAYAADQKMGYKLNAGTADADDKQKTADALNTASQALDAAKKNVDYDSAEKAYNEAEQSYEQKSDSLDNLKDTYEKAQDNVDSAKEKLDEAGESDTLDDLKDQLKNCTITATSDGIITEVDATVGSNAQSGSTLFVVQDPDNLVISVSIDEADVQELKTGLAAEITSDATGETIINGELSQLSQIASTATSGQGGMSSSSSSSTSSSTFSAQIKVTDADTGLLIGMNVSADIVVTKAEDVFVVPYDAVGTDESGNKVVYVQNGDTFEPVTVETGMETDYYIVISGDGLTEGASVRSSADETSIDATTADGETAQSGGMMNFGGMGGSGEMPSGGGNFGGGNRPSGGGQMPS
ncbi:MAG: efflux RND transporter periplasmic adaptor subunit [Oscillospiraceae bacterium]